MATKKKAAPEPATVESTEPVEQPAKVLRIDPATNELVAVDPDTDR
jgi:hypothetical protein